MAYTELFSEGHYPLAKINPASYSAEQNSGRVSLSQYHRAVAIIHAGVLDSGETLDADLEQADAASGGTLKAIAGKSITQLDNDDDGAVVAIELRSEELDVDGGFEYINLELTPSAAMICSAIVYGIAPRFQPVPTTNWTQIVQ